MVLIAVQAANVQGDIGGQGISRIHWQRVDAATPTSPDCNAAAAAWHSLLSSISTYIPNTVTWSWQSSVTVIDHASAQLQAYVPVTTVPANITGVGSTTYPAGNGARLDWLTQSLHGRRFMRAANFMVPLSGGAYTTTGQVSSAVVSALQTAAGTFLGALSTAGLELVAYGRPAKGQTSGGHVGLVTAYRVPSQPATLRSRRQ